MKATMTNTLLASAILLALAGCARDDEGKGPAERVGKALDQATAGVTNSVKDEIARADDAVENARNKVNEGIWSVIFVSASAPELVKACTADYECWVDL